MDLPSLNPGHPTALFIAIFFIVYPTAGMAIFYDCRKIHPLNARSISLLLCTIIPQSLYGCVVNFVIFFGRQNFPCIFHGVLKGVLSISIGCGYGIYSLHLFTRWKIQTAAHTMSPPSSSHFRLFRWLSNDRHLISVWAFAIVALSSPYFAFFGKVVCDPNFALFRTYNYVLAALFSFIICRTSQPCS
jgi:hypothetical protein